MATSSASHATALVLLPPPHIAEVVNALRSANDKSCPRWSAHVTVLFPLGTVQDLPQITDTLRSALATSEPFHISLDKLGRFSTRDYETVYLGTSNPTEAQALWRTVIKAMAHNTSGRSYIPHMTLGQTARNSDSIAFLTGKGTKLLERHDFGWFVESVALLRKCEDRGGVMEVYAHIPLGPHNNNFSQVGTVFGTPTYHFDGCRWTPRAPVPSTSPITSFSVATYNLLHDHAFPFPSRLTHVLDAILESDADIICLQELTDESISLVLRDERICQRWPWCSRHDMAVMESERNVIMLAREEFGFEWTRVELGGRHKACVVARIRNRQLQHDKSIIIAGIHLTAGRTAPILDTKRDEVAKLLAYLRQHHEGDEWIIMGDVNWPEDEDFPGNDVLLDVWAEAIGGTGWTYDPTTNPLAAATARQTRDPERYDRVFVKKGGRLAVNPKGTNLFGLPKDGGAVGSDHWGLRVDLQLNDGQASQSSQAVEQFASPLPTPTLQFLPTYFDDDQLREFCTEQKCFPSDDQHRQFQNAVDTLRNFLASWSSPSSQSVVDGIAATPSAVRLVLALVGSFAMGYHTPNSDVDCVVVGNISPASFWSLLRLKIRALESTKTIRLRRFVKDALVQMMELDICGVKIDLQYCPASQLAECWDDLPNIPRDSPLFSLPVSTLRTLNAHRDTVLLLNTLPLDTFRLAHRALKLVLRNRGIIGARFGFLGGFHLAFLLARICFQAPPNATAAQLVRLVFHIYARWDWDRDAVTVPLLGMERAGLGYRRSKREPMVVLSLEKPQVNMTVNANPNSVEVMKNMFTDADRACEEGLSWKAVCGETQSDSEPPFKRFVTNQKAFVKIDVNYWGNSCTKGRALIGWLESRFVGLLVQLRISAPTICAHLWPARLADESNIDDLALNGFYLIGLSVSATAPKSGQQKQSVRMANSEFKSAMTTALRAFEADIKSNTRFYDPSEMFICLTSVTASALPSALVLDTHQWSDGGFDGDGDDQDLIDEEESFDNQSENVSPDLAPTPRKNHPHLTSTSHLPAAKLRTSSDVYNRLMWDPSVSKEDYVIGYEDRFKGTREIPLTSWKREVEDEAFIPFHRVIHFRRKSDNVTVWDRKTKTDLVFGSGVKVQ